MSNIVRLLQLMANEPNERIGKVNNGRKRYFVFNIITKFSSDDELKFNIDYFDTGKNLEYYPICRGNQSLNFLLVDEFDRLLSSKQLTLLKQCQTVCSEKIKTKLDYVIKFIEMVINDKNKENEIKNKMKEKLVAVVKNKANIKEMIKNVYCTIFVDGDNLLLNDEVYEFWAHNYIYVPVDHLNEKSVLTGEPIRHKNIKSKLNSYPIAANGCYSVISYNNKTQTPYNNGVLNGNIDMREYSNICYNIAKLLSSNCLVRVYKNHIKYNHKVNSFNNIVIINDLMDIEILDDLDFIVSNNYNEFKKLLAVLHYCNEHVPLYNNTNNIIMSNFEITGEHRNKVLLQVINQATIQSVIQNIQKYREAVLNVKKYKDETNYNKVSEIVKIMNSLQGLLKLNVDDALYVKYYIALYQTAIFGIPLPDQLILDVLKIANDVFCFTNVATNGNACLYPHLNFKHITKEQYNIVESLAILLSLILQFNYNGVQSEIGKNCAELVIAADKIKRKYYQNSTSKTFLQQQTLPLFQNINLGLFNINSAINHYVNNKLNCYLELEYYKALSKIDFINHSNSFNVWDKITYYYTIFVNQKRKEK